MTIRDAELYQLAKDCEAFNHIFEVLDQCNRQGKVMIDPDALQRVVHVLNQHIMQAVARLYDP